MYRILLLNQEFASLDDVSAPLEGCRPIGVLCGPKNIKWSRTRWEGIYISFLGWCSDSNTMYVRYNSPSGRSNIAPGENPYSLRLFYFYNVGIPSRTHGTYLETRSFARFLDIHQYCFISAFCKSFRSA